MSQTHSTEQSVETLKTYIRAWATNDKDLLLSIFADDCVLEDPVGTPAFAGVRVWLPTRSVRYGVAFGEPFAVADEVDGERQLREAFASLYAELGRELH